jgi:hypothetical protein
MGRQSTGSTATDVKHHPIVVASVVAVLAACAVISAMIVLRSPDVDDKETNDLALLADSFPVPPDSQQAFPDAISDEAATKGWWSSSSLDATCEAWRNSFRTWFGATATGNVTGDDVPGRSCSLSGPKDGHRVDLSVATYGDDPRPSITLSIHR